MMRRWFMITTCLLGGFASAASTTQPAPATQPLSTVRPPFDAIRRMPPEQISLIDDFAKQHMPNLFHLASYSQPWRRNHLLRYAYARMITYNQSRYSESLSDRVDRDIQTEDAMFALVAQWEGASASEQSAIHDKIHDTMRQVVDNLLQERQDRLDRLKERISDEESKLQEDRAHHDAIVDDRVERLLSDSPYHEWPATNPSPPTTMPVK